MSRSLGLRFQMSLIVYAAAKAFFGLFYKVTTNCNPTKPYNKSLINLVCSVCTQWRSREVGQLLAKRHGKFACVYTLCVIHARPVVKRTSPRDKQIWKLSKEECQAVIFQENSAIYIYIKTGLLKFHMFGILKWIKCQQIHLSSYG